MEKEHFTGFRKVEVRDDHLDVTFPMFVFYPTDEPEKEERIGPYPMHVATGADLSNGTYPLVIVSHGTGGTPLVYRGLAKALAASGFIVAMPEHPFNNIHDNRFKDSMELLESRPKHITQAIDWFMEDHSFRDHIKQDDISMIGHSMGGYTAVAAAGGIPTSLPGETEGGSPVVVDVEKEKRIKKLILLAPALGWFREKGALDHVHLPIFVMTGEKDEVTPSFHAELLRQGVKHPEMIEHKVVENGGHFSFLTPFPEAMKSASFPPSQDPEGFDREGFHERLHVDILQFLLK
ncbi:alpha/beta fold hydrolase [Halobacillus litoralis]|uniref:alpha/beta hydrolase family protein n=1 Tax=Halobacillus litoralis TaxID=45668 RepID=UPI001CD7AE57|nr:alpha/beta fold hydrolase [Halobacillus litoralis]MCA0970800.1 alpha/beta fold hydrolase [Halobacillus litoralis]